MAEIERYVEYAMNYIEEAGSTLFHYSSADFIWSSGFVGVNFLKDFIDIFFCYRDRGFMDFSFFEVRYSTLLNFSDLTRTGYHTAMCGNQTEIIGY